MKTESESGSSSDDTEKSDVINLLGDAGELTDGDKAFMKSSEECHLRSDLTEPRGYGISLRRKMAQADSDVLAKKCSDE